MLRQSRYPLPVHAAYLERRYAYYELCDVAPLPCTVHLYSFARPSFFPVESATWAAYGDDALMDSDRWHVWHNLSTDAGGTVLSCS